jgi:hypothetical protein
MISHQLLLVACLVAFWDAFPPLEFAGRPARRPSFLCSFVFADTRTERKKYERFDENRTAAFLKIWIPEIL